MKEQSSNQTICDILIIFLLLHMREFFDMINIAIDYANNSYVDTFVAGVV